MSDFFAMNGYGGYIWSAYGLTLAVMLLNVWWARRSLRDARADARRRLAMEDTP
jgi:heme exporter protein CcmD